MEAEADLVNVGDIPHRGQSLLSEAGLQEDGAGLDSRQEARFGLVVGLELGHVLHPLLLGDGPLYGGRGWPSSGGAASLRAAPRG